MHTYTSTKSVVYIDNSFTVKNRDDIKKDDLLYFIPFLANRKVFLVGSSILNDHGINVDARREIQAQIGNVTYLIKHKDILKNNNIQYLYMSRNNPFTKSKKLTFLTTVYQNPEVILYKITY